jgi:hypothetical protein
MPTAKFEADFSSFIAAISAAQWSMADLGKGADTVQQRLNDMSDQFSGRELIQEASLMTIAVEKIGGTAALTSDELREVGTTANDAVEKLKAMGSDVPKGLQDLADATKANVTATDEWSSALGGLQGVLGAVGIATSVSGFIEFTKSLMTGAAEITNLSAKLQSSVLDVQRFQDIAAATGVPIDSMVGGMQRLSEKIGQGDAGTIGALNKLGISVDQFKNNTMYQDFVQIAAGIDKMGDSETKNAEARALFGNSFKQLTPALTSDIDAIANSTIKMSTGQVAVLDSWSTQWHNAWTDFKSVSAGIIAAYEGVDIAMIDYAAQVAKIPEPKLPQPEPIAKAAVAIENLGGATADLNKQLADQKTHYDNWLATLGRIDDASANLADTLHDMDAKTIADGEALLKLGVNASDVAERLGIADVQVKALQADLDATKTYQTAITNIIAATTDWAASLSTLSPIVKQEAEAELALGAKVQDVAVKYGRAAGEVDAMNQQVQAAATYTKQWQDATDRINASYTDWLAVAQQLPQSFQDTIRYQIAAGDSAKDVAIELNIQVEAVNALIAADKALQNQEKQHASDKEKLADVYKVMNAGTVADAEANAKKLIDTTQYLQDQQHITTMDTIDGFTAQKKAAQDTADAMIAAAKAKAAAEGAASDSIVQSISNVRNAMGTIKAGDAAEQAAMNDALAEVNNTSLGRMIAQGTQNVDLMNQYQKAIEDAMAARGYSIGGGLTPAAMAQGASASTGNVNTTVNVQGSTLSTSAQIAAAVSQAMTQALKGSGYTLPSA